MSDPLWEPFARNSMVGSALLVTHPTHTRRYAVERAMERIDRTGFPLAGCLLDRGAVAGASERLSRLARHIAGAPATPGS